VEAVRLVRDGEIGALQAVQSFFSYYNDDPTDIRNRLETMLRRCGVAIMDGRYGHRGEVLSRPPTRSEHHPRTPRSRQR